MPTFVYHAFDSSGLRVTGEITASSAATARTQLEAEGLRVERILPLDVDEPARETGPADLGRPLSDGEFRELGGHLADLAQAGVPLAGGFEAIAAELPDGPFRKRLEHMARQLRTGADLEEVLQRHDAPCDLTAVVRAGIRSGRLVDVLARYAADARNADELRQRVLLGLAYPLALLGVALALFIGFLCGIVPQFKPIFAGMDVELPLLTELVIWLSDLLVDHGLLIAIALLCAVAVAWYAGGKRFGRETRQRWLVRFPVAGSLLRNVAVGRYAHLLAQFIESGMPLPAALRLTGQSVLDAGLIRASDELACDVESGEPLSAATHAAGGFPASFIETLSRQQYGANLPSALRALADVFENRVRNESRYVLLFFEPAMVVIVGGLMMSLVAALFLPLIMLLNYLS